MTSARGSLNKVERKGKTARSSLFDLGQRGSVVSLVVPLLRTRRGKSREHFLQEEAPKRRGSGGFLSHGVKRILSPREKGGGESRCWPLRLLGPLRKKGEHLLSCARPRTPRHRRKGKRKKLFSLVQGREETCRPTIPGFVERGRGKRLLVSHLQLLLAGGSLQRKACFESRLIAKRGWSLPARSGGREKRVLWSLRREFMKRKRGFF